ncbi:MAG: adhesin [Providencia sp.]|uniref:adhesin n=1 Tax=Providencia sp. TaxID=589 RepID=UPI003F9E6DEB
MFNLKSKISTYPISFFLLFFILYSIKTNADYAAKIQNPTAGYLIKLDSNSVIEPTSHRGTDGKNYYRVGQPIVVEGGGSSVSVTGLVDCVGRRWGDSNTQILSDNAFHRLFMYVPTLGTNIEGKVAYRINSNLMMTVETRIMNWLNINAGMCSYSYPGMTRPASNFTNQFPITITFYINERIIDGQLVIAEIDLGGYVRAFTAQKTVPPYDSWPLNESTVPMRLAASQLNVGALCSTMTSTGQAGTVNLRHGQLNSLNYDSTVMEKITYSCKFVSSTRVHLRLDYATDDDPQKRLPLTNDLNQKIYSQLVLIDELTGQSGTDFRLDIHGSREINIRSRIQGENADAGDYHGSAWLIATFD